MTGHFLLCQGWTKWLRAEVAKPDMSQRHSRSSLQPTLWVGLTFLVCSALSPPRIGLSLPWNFLWPPDLSLLKQTAPRTGQIPHSLFAQEVN